MDCFPRILLVKPIRIYLPIEPSFQNTLNNQRFYLLFIHVQFFGEEFEGNGSVRFQEENQRVESNTLGKVVEDFKDETVFLERFDN